MRNTEKPPVDAVENLLFADPMPDGDILGAQDFLSRNEGTIRYALLQSVQRRRRTMRLRAAVVFSVLFAITMVFSLSARARAFASGVFYQITEWFVPEKDRSGVTFDIEGKGITASEPLRVPEEKEGVKVSFDSIAEAEELYACGLFILDDPAFQFVDGYVQDRTICMNYEAGNARVQLVEEPVQQSGAVSYHFNTADFEKRETPVGTLYCRYEKGELFGGIMTGETSITLSAVDLAPDQYDTLVDAIASVR